MFDGRYITHKNGVWTHKNGDFLGMVYDIVFSANERKNTLMEKDLNLVVHHHFQSNK